MESIFGELNREISEVKLRISVRDKLARRLEQARHNLAVEMNRASEFKLQLRKEEIDVEKLEGLSLTNLFYTVLGSKEQQLDKERQEFLAAKFRFESAEASVSALKKEINELEFQLAAVEDLDAKFENLLRRKEDLLRQSNRPEVSDLFRLGEQENALRCKVRELDEAIQAGEASIASLEDVLSALASAGNWGTFDMLGGGLLATAVKHSRIDEARKCAHDAQQCLRIFSTELADVNCSSELSIEIGGFATFADYFFDGLIADWVVQSRIRESEDRAADVKDQVLKLLDSLQTELQTVKSEIGELAKERIALLEDIT